jgi:hypothetical protein
MLRTCGTSRLQTRSALQTEIRTIILCVALTLYVHVSRISAFLAGACCARASIDDTMQTAALKSATHEAPAKTLGTELLHQNLLAVIGVHEPEAAITPAPRTYE